MADKEMTVRELPVELNDEEVMAKAKELAKLQQDKQAQEEQAKSAAATFKDRIASAVARISILSRDISNGYEYREVDCQWRYDWKAGRKSLIRLDTTAIVRTEEITASERQGHLEDDLDQPGDGDTYKMDPK
jgi:hypothetical protein